MSLLVIDRIEVGDDRLDAIVRVLDPSRLRTSARTDLATEALALLPGLKRHTCENDAGASFAEELRDTETAHLLEHVACELMALAGSPRSLRGETSWDFARDGVGVFRLRLAFEDDVVALGALKEAVPIVEWLALRGGPRPDIPATIGRLRGLRP